MDMKSIIQGTIEGDPELLLNPAEGQNICDSSRKIPDPPVPGVKTPKIGSLSPCVTLDMHGSFNVVNVAEEVSVAKDINGGLIVKEHPGGWDGSSRRSVPVPRIGGIV